MMSKLPIRTVYYRGEKIVRTNCARLVFNAVPNAIKHIQVKGYDSTHCEVYDSVSGDLYAVIQYTRKREVVILFKHDMKEGV